MAVMQRTLKLRRSSSPTAALFSTVLRLEQLSKQYPNEC